MSSPYCSTTALFIICIILAGCAPSQAIATSENRLLTPSSTLTSIPITPSSVCTDEPDKLLPPDRAATLEFSNIPVELKPGTDWINPQVKEGLEFSIWGVYAIDKEIAFIFGSLKVSAGTIRSLMLRSVDGGKNWKEVMTPINHNDITHVVFIGEGEGWAIATWTLEGMLGTRLWHTTNYGETWQESKANSPLANPPVESITGIRVFDNKHIQIKSLFYWSNPYADRYRIMDSYDGGLNWNESFSIPVNGKDLDAVIEAYADTPGGHYGSYYTCSMWENNCVAYGQEGSKWQVQYISSKKCLDAKGKWADYINRKQYAEIHRIWQEKETSYAIPIYFIIEGNEIHVRP